MIKLERGHLARKRFSAVSGQDGRVPTNDKSLNRIHQIGKPQPRKLYSTIKLMRHFRTAIPLKHFSQNCVTKNF